MVLTFIYFKDDTTDIITDITYSTIWRSYQNNVKSITYSKGKSSSSDVEKFNNQSEDSVKLNIFSVDGYSKDNTPAILDSKNDRKTNKKDVNDSSL